MPNLYHDDGVPGPEVLSDWNRSGVGRLQPRHDNKLLTAFKKHLENVLVMQIHPDKMLAKSGKETAHPNKDMSELRCVVSASLPGSAEPGF